MKSFKIKKRAYQNNGREVKNVILLFVLRKF
jgi:hypothetical protein